MSPEQARGGKHVGARTDLFSLGCVLYAPCTGELPFQGDSPIAVLTALATRNPTPPHKSPDRASPALAPKFDQESTKGRNHEKHWIP